MKVDLTHETKRRVSQVSRSELRRVPEQRKVDISKLLDNGLVFQHELWIVLEPKDVLVAHPVKIGSATLAGAQSCKGWGRNTIGNTHQLEREFIFQT